MLDLLAGPLNLTAYGQPCTGRQASPQVFGDSAGLVRVLWKPWGATIFTSTQVAAGTAVVMSVKAGAGIFWQRLGLLIMFDPYTLLSSNEYRWVGADRVRLPQAGGDEHRDRVADLMMPAYPLQLGPQLEEDVNPIAGDVF